MSTTLEKATSRVQILPREQNDRALIRRAGLVGGPAVASATALSPSI
jgi:hypothetical protein